MNRTLKLYFNPEMPSKVQTSIGKEGRSRRKAITIALLRFMVESGELAYTKVARAK